MSARVHLFRPDEGPSEVTVSEVCNAYLTDLGRRMSLGHVTDRCYEKDGYYLRAFMRATGAKPVSEAKGRDLREWLLSNPQWRSPHTQLDAAGAVVRAFRWAADDDQGALIPFSPFRKPKGLIASPQPREPITEAEVQRVLKQARAWGYGWRHRRKSREAFRIALWFLWETGARTVEMRRMRWEQYDPERGIFRLPSKTTRRTGELRIIVLPYRAWRLVQYLRARDKRQEGPVFLNGLGKPWTCGNFAAQFRKHARRCKVREQVSPYSARHGFTCERLEAGCSDREVADLLGHSGVRFVGWYGRGTRQRIRYLRAAADRRRVD